MIKNSQPFGKKIVRKLRGGFFDSHCRSIHKESLKQGGTLPLPHEAVQDRQISQTKKHFRWWNVSDDLCRMGSWSFWSWFDV